MNYEEFVGVVKKEVEHMVGRDMRVELHTAMKNNGKEKIGLLIKDEKVNIAPAIYLEEYYSMWNEGEGVEVIARSIWNLYRKICFDKSFDVSGYSDYGVIKNKLACKLINYQKNQLLFEDTPYVQYLDLAIVFYVLVESGSCGMMSVLIKNVHRDAWGVSIEQLYTDALDNTERILPAKFQTMTSVILELLDEGAEVSKREERMYVLSNEYRNFGAACWLYKDELKKIGGILKESFYILPSSIHEVIIVPKSEAPNRVELDDMIDEINRTQVEAEEILSSHAYYYEHTREMILY